MTKYLLFLCSITILLPGCSPSSPQDTPMNTAQNTVSGECAPGEELADGKCVTAGTGTNVSLFNEDVDSFVTGSLYDTGGLRGYYVEPTASGSYPGIIMIHEWWGLNENIEYMAKLLAKSGYRVFAIDLYGEVATDAARARELSTKVRENPADANEKMKLALAYLKDVEQATKIGTLGWCFGGAQSLNVSLETPVDATVIYYGNLSEDLSKLINLKGPLLGIFGDKDTSIPFEKIKLFQKNLTSLKKDHKVYVYPGLGHAFANPSGNNYAAKETIDAWKKTTDFLEKNLK